MKTKFYRAFDTEPTTEELKNIFSQSAAENWMYDEESEVFTLRDNLLIFLSKDDKGNYYLRYGYQNVFQVNNSELKQHVEFPKKVAQAI